MERSEIRGLRRLQDRSRIADYFLLDSELGHSASGLDAHKWAPSLKVFMESL